jgi:hypothetical protein
MDRSRIDERNTHDTPSPSSISQVNATTTVMLSSCAKWSDDIILRVVEVVADVFFNIIL